MSKRPRDLTVHPSSERGSCATGDERPANQRKFERYETAKPLIVVAVLADGALDWANKSVGMSLDVSEGGMGMIVDRHADQMPRSILVGVEDETGENHFAGMLVCYAKPALSRGAYVGARFGGPAEKFLDEQKLIPQFSAESLGIEYTLPRETLDAWVEAGVLQRTLCDQILVCPRCHSLPTFRNGCRKCSSARVQRDQLIHHFACAHVDLAQEFQHDGILECPKCRTKNMVVGADFEYLHGGYHCLDCQWSDSTLEPIAHCLSCNYRFAAEQALAEDVYTYRADRLHWKSIVGSS
jgi:hypothetical protein